MNLKFVLFLLVTQKSASIFSTRIFAHLMPWFETKQSNGGTWGIHWTMTNRNPDRIVNGVQEIASYYHPLIGAYASGDAAVIDWQLGLMKLAGITGVFIDWPGTTNFADYPKNKRNTEEIIKGTQRVGLQFAIVYEDHNLALANVPNKVQQATADMQYLQNNYFNKPNYVKVDGAPLLMDFGPQTLTSGQQWDQVFAPLNPKPCFLTLWYQHSQGGASNKGEYSWIYQDFLNGLRSWYANVKLPVKIGGAYPGFRTFYKEGGWPGPSFTLPYSVDTFRQTLDLAIANTEMVQLATWNDYGEGTIVEPTTEFQYQMLNVVREKTRSRYAPQDFDEMTRIYNDRKQNPNNPAALARFNALIHKFG